MKKEKLYEYTIIDSNTIEKIVTEFQSIVATPNETKFLTLKIGKINEEWDYDTFEEFLVELRQEYYDSTLWVSNPELVLRISTRRSESASASKVSIESESRNKILRLGNIVDGFTNDCYLPPPKEKEKIPPKPKIFIGHGSSTQWRDLKDHLQDQHGYEIVSYETGSRAGHSIRDVIDELLKISSFAILVMTGEDTMDDGKTRARQNVIHEIGLFQGKLGYTKAIVLKEDDTEEFSNIHGVHQLRYSKGKIKETFGEVLATLSREFGARR